MASADLQRRVDRLAGQLGRSVVVTDPGTQLLYSSPHYGDEDQVRVQAILRRSASSRAVSHLLAQGVHHWTRLGRVPAAPEIGMESRLCAPVRFHGELLGLVMVIDRDATVTVAERESLEVLAGDIAPMILAERRAASEATSREEGRLFSLLGADPAARREALIALSSSLEPIHPDGVRVVLITAQSHPAPVEAAQAETTLRHVLNTVRTRHRGAALSLVRGRSAALVRRRAGDAGDRDLAQELLSETVDFGDHRYVCGMGSVVDDLAEAWRSLRQAVLAARAALLLQHGAIVDWADLGPLQVLMRIPPSELDATAVPEALSRLAADDPSGRLRETLAAYLDRGGSTAATATALHIHRTTLYYRLDRLRELTGADLDDGRARLALQLGLALQEVLAALRQREENGDADSYFHVW